MNTSHDEIARRAAELHRDGLAATLDEAIRQARRQLGTMSTGSPSIAEVRRHVHAMEMSRIGLDGWRAIRRVRLEALDQFLATLEFHLVDIEMCVVGRAALGEIDQGDRIHIRVWIDERLESVVRVLEEADVGEMKVGSRRLNPSIACGVPRVSTLLINSDHVEYMVAFCPRRELVTLPRNLVTGSDIQLADIKHVRSMLSDSPS